AGPSYFYTDPAAGLNDSYQNTTDIPTGKYVIEGINGNEQLASAPDTTAPTAPGSLTATATSSTEIDLSWTASTDNYAVGSYQIFRSGTEVGTTTTTSYRDTGLASSTAYSYVVKAIDVAGNLTSASNTANATTTGASYSGPGDLVSGALAWWGLRGYSSSYHGKAINIIRASDSSSTDIDILASGALDVATASTFCASTTCVVDELYDQTGDGFNLLQSDGRFQPSLAFNCIGSLPCLSFAPTGGSGGNPQFITSVATTSQSKPITYSVVAERTGDVTSVGPILFDQNGAGWLQFNNVANQLCAYGGGSCLTAVNGT